jgi:hypothetical protein
MSVVSRIQEIEGHIGDIYDTLELGGDSTQNKNIVNINSEIKREYKDFLANGTDTLWNNWNKVSGTGESLTLNNTIKAKMKIDLKGNTSQDSTTGKNKLQYTLEDLKTNNTGGTWNNNVYTWNGITFTINDDLSITVNGTATSVSYIYVNFYNLGLTSGTEYILNGCPSGGGVSTYSLRIYAGNSYSSDLGNGLSFTFNNQTIVRVNVSNGKNVNNLLFQPMIRLSSITDDTYEPYTGGNPAPNPDYPYPVNVVTGDNEIVVCGKNLANIYVIPNQTKNLTLTIANDTITISNNQNSVGYTNTNTKLSDLCPNLQVGDTAYLFYDTTSTSSSKNIIYIGTSWSNNSSKEITQAMLDSNVVIYGGYNETAVISHFMITKVNDNTYEPYQSTTYPINLGSMELCKIGDYQDSIVKDNGKWYLNKQIGKVVLDGSENWSLSTSYNAYSFWKTNTDLGTVDGRVPKICDNFLYTTQSFNIAPKPSLCENTGATNMFVFKTDGSYGQTTQEWKTWLSTHNTIVYYPLATPTYEEITDSTLISQLEAIKLSYNEQTNISQENNDKPFILDVTALGELE